LPSRKSIAAAAALLFATGARAVTLSPSFVDRFSISGFAPPPAPPFTLLDPSWLLPPLAALEDAAALADGAERADQLLHDDAPLASIAPGHASDAPFAYSLADGVTAHVDYRRAQIFDRASSQALRNDASTTFSTRPDRDVLDLNMSWRLAGNTVGLGYQIESARSGTGIGEINVSRFMPGNPQAVHSLTLGLSRQWGGEAAPPVLVEPPLLPPEVDVAQAEATPTP
jgi:hypothetical protein